VVVDRLFSEPGLAELYDRWDPWERRGDFGFYLPLAMSAEAVLDVGCGTGELLRRAREAGHAGRLCGLDPADAMLDQARTRSDIEWVLGDLASVAWDQEFDLAVMTGHAFQVFVEDDEIRASLATIRSALTEDGRFAFETRNVRCATNPLGVKGAGEAGTIGSAPAVMNAVVDALYRAFRIRHVDMPATPERLWAAIREGKRVHTM